MSTSAINSTTTTTTGGINTQEQAQAKFTFVTLPQAPTYYADVARIFNQTIAPIYGNGPEILERISRDSSTLKCTVLLKDGQIVAFAIYKNELQPRNSDKKTPRSFDLRHLQLINSHDSGSGFTTKLFQHIETLAKQLFAETIHANIAESDKDLKGYLVHKGFKLEEGFSGRTAADYKTQLYSLRLPEPERASRKRERSEERAPEYDPQKSNQRVVTRVEPVAPPVISYPPKLNQVTLRKIYIDQIRFQGKTIEGRLCKGMFTRFKVGEQARFFYQQNPQDDIICEITAINKYPSFLEMLRAEGFKKCLPNSPSLESAAGEYDRIPGYTADAATHGVLAIHIKLIK